MSRLTRFISNTVIGAALTVGAVSANANLIVNGGFEDPTIAPGTWSFFSSSAVDGWDGSNLEIWNNHGGVLAHEGNQYAELNAHPGTGSAFTIYQEFTTEAGQWYDLSFAYQARANDSEAFEASVAGLTWLFDDHAPGTWSVFSTSFQATGALSTLAFTTVVPLTGTIGNFLDDVVVTAQVAEPGTLALLGLGLFGLGVARRRNAS